MTPTEAKALAERLADDLLHKLAHLDDNPTMMDCATCSGSGMWAGKPCDMCGGAGEGWDIKADEKRIRDVTVAALTDAASALRQPVDEGTVERVHAAAEGWRPLDDHARSGERMLLMWDDNMFLEPHWEAGQYKADVGFTNTYGKPFDGDPTHYQIVKVPDSPPTISEGWRDISTAPKDGTIVDLWVNDRDVTDCRYTDCKWCKPEHKCSSQYCDSCPEDMNAYAWRDALTGFEYKVMNVTHWKRLDRPAPSPPALKD